MMYDDIANNPSNPKKGKIFNKPGGPNVYGPKAVNKDYVGDDVTPENFVHVLTGNHEAVRGVGSGKVLKSGPNDHVFVNFVDHGAPGLIGFPNDVMHADDLIRALKTMHKKNMYKKLVFYMEACESGSMFDKILPKNIEIFATTAANPTESSYACYWSDEVQAYLGDEYSVSWMEDTDAPVCGSPSNTVPMTPSHPQVLGIRLTFTERRYFHYTLKAEKHKRFSSETLLKQYKNVVKRVKESHPSMYGEKTIDKDHVQDFLGKSKQKVTFYSESPSQLESFNDAVPSRDVPLHVLTKKIALAETAEEKEKLQKEKEDLVKGRKEIDQLLSRILSHVTNLDIEEIQNIETTRQDINLEMMPCYKTLVKAFSEKCVNIHKNQYTFSHLYKLANMCALQYSSTDILEAFSAECGSLHQEMVNVN
ncbi:hypothetical protein J6590_060925 [Homalodisca vitripennis]|nr:hypothetical protein J6590_060925 [Homalodisca vitripennis]